MFLEVDRLVGLRGEFDLIRSLIDAEGGASSLDMFLNVRPLDGNLVGADIYTCNDGRHHVAHNDDAYYCDQGGSPAAGEQQPRRNYASGDFDPLQWQDDVLIHIVDANHEAAMFFEQQIVAREEKARGQGNQEHSA